MADPAPAPRARLTADLLAVRTGLTRGYTTDTESDAGSVAGDIAPSPAAVATATSSGGVSHDPYARSGATLREALASLGPSASAAATRRAPSAQQQQHQSQPYASAFDGLTPFARHKLLASDYQKYYARPTASSAAAASAASSSLVHTTTDATVLRDAHRFVRSAADDLAAAAGNAEQRFAKRYYDRLFKEYALVDLSQYKTGRIGLRWRTEAEVLSGRGQFTCGAVGARRCPTTTEAPAAAAAAGLRSFELNFGYSEEGRQKQALVKVRLCAECATRLHYQKVKELDQARKSERREKREKRREEKSTKKSKKKSKKSKKSTKEKDEVGDEKSEKKSKRKHESSSSDTSDTDSSSSDADSQPTSADREQASSGSRSAKRVRREPVDLVSPPAAAAAAADGFAVPEPRPPSSRLASTPAATAYAAAAGGAATAAVGGASREDELFRELFP